MKKNNGWFILCMLVITIFVTTAVVVPLSVVSELVAVYDLLGCTDLVPVVVTLDLVLSSKSAFNESFANLAEYEVNPAVGTLVF